ncbi:MAG: hypothetical protein ACREYF_09145 [Gammaproteobacteria bacterium]
MRTEPTFVRYESDKIFVNIYHGRSSYELGIEVGPLGSGVEIDMGYSLSALIHLVAPEEAAAYRNFVATTPKKVQIGVKLLSEKFQGYGWDLLWGDPDIFIKLKTQRAQLSERFAMEVLARQVRPKADAAFRSKDYGEAIRLYGSIRNQLTPVELKKLDYAQKHRHSQR